jgi:SSS family solute:Na+ symporter
MLVATVLPRPLVGFFAAVLFGAILSSFNSVLNSSVTLFGVDIYKQHINPNASELEMVKNGKRFGLILAIAAMCIAPMIANAGTLFDYLQEVNGIYSIPILTVIFVGYTTKRVPAIAAKIGVISGSVLYIFSQFILQPMVTEYGGTYPHYLDVMAILFLLNTVIMLLIGKLKPMDTPYELSYTKQVDILPFQYVKQVGLGICVLVIGVYIYFA